MPTTSYDFETKNYTASGRSIIKLDTMMNISHLNLRFDITDYDTGTGGAIVTEGWATGLINNFKVGQGTRYPIAINGIDLPYLGMLLTRGPVDHKMVASTTATASDARCRMQLPISLPAGLYPNAEVVVEWGAVTGIGADQTVVAAALNGSVAYTDDPVPPFKCVTQTQHTGVSSGTQRFDVDPEGKLSKIFLIVKNNASPKALAGNVDTVSLRVEGVEIFETEFEDMRLAWQRYAPSVGLNTTYGMDAGFGIIELSDELPIIGTNSHLFVEVDATSSDLVAGFIYESDDRQPAAPDISSALAGQRPMARKVTGAPRTTNVNMPGYTPAPVGGKSPVRNRRSRRRGW